MALITRPKSPYWWVDIAPLDGARVRFSTKIRHDAPTPDLRRENKRLAQVIEHEQYTTLARRRQGDEPAERISFAAYADWYETHLTAHKRGAEREREILGTLCAHFGRLALAEVSREAAAEFVTERRKAVSASTVDRELDVLKHMLSSAVPAHLSASPIARMKRLRRVNRAVAVLSRADEAKVLRVLSPPDQAIVIAALDTLARAGELLELRWLEDHGSHLAILNPKAGGARKVPVSRRLRTALDALRRTAKAKGYVFAHRRMAKAPRARTNSLKQMFEDACRRAGVGYGRAQDGITFHGLRHTGATRMIEAGVSVRIVQAIGGWSDLRLLTRYTHPGEAAMRAAVETVGSVPSSVPGAREAARVLERSREATVTAKS